MSGPIAARDYKAQVLQAVDIVELIGRSVALKRRGRDFVGLCPFHQEKTPSFHVSPSKQYFHCYGCRAGGNVIDFVMRLDRVEFIEALRTLGRQAGIEMPKFGVSKENPGERQMLLDAHSSACGFFEKLLSQPQDGLAARNYLAQRGIEAEMIRRFQIGVSPDAWDGLLTSPVGRKFPPPVLALAGLVKARESGGGHYDTFRNRLMFPIRDEGGRIIAFGGRVMPGSEDPAKYLNSPETPLFSKSRCIFGLDLARQKIVETRTVAVVEGYTDVLMAHQFGVANVVSILGTAMTEQHVGILRRFADRIVLLFDADIAGDAAVNRAVEMFLTQPVEMAIASMPQGVDPDEYLLKNGPQAFTTLLDNATDALTYHWRQLNRRFASNEEDLTGRQKAVQQYLQTLADARGMGNIDPLRWGSVLARVSRLAEIPVEELNRRFKTNKPSPRNRLAQVQPDGEPTNPPPAPPPAGAQDLAERWILGILLAQPRRWHDVQQQVHVEEFVDPQRKKLAEIYWNHQRDEGEPVFNEFLGLLHEPALTELAVEVVEEVEAMSDLDQTLIDAIGHLSRMRQQAEEQKLMAQLRRTNERLTEQDQVAVLQQLQEKARGRR